MKHGTIYCYNYYKCRCVDCKAANALSSREWRAKNTEKSLEIVRKSTKKARENHKKLRLELKSVPCADCGIQYPYYVMDFDHIEEKEFNIGSKSNYSISRTLVEASKCEVVCSNCHRERTYQRKRV